MKTWLNKLGIVIMVVIVSANFANLGLGDIIFFGFGAALFVMDWK